MQILLVFIFLTTCKKTDTTNPNPTPIPINPTLTANTIIVSNGAINASLILVDSTKLVFNSTGTGIDKIKVGSILVSDISNVAPLGFLRKVTSVTTTNGQLICTTDQASLTDAIIQGDVQYNKVFTDNDIIGADSSGIDISALQRVQGLSFNFSYKVVVYDADGNNQTTYDQVYIEGDMKVEPTFNFQLKIDGASIKKFVVSMTLKNTNNIKAESKATLASLSKEVVLKTFELQPFTIPIAGVPIPIAKQWIAIVLGIDGNLTARVTTGAQNVNTINAGISYENSTWNNINTIDNSLSLQPLTFEGAARVEPWLQVRYEIRPYGIKQSRIYVGARGSVIGEATISPTGLDLAIKWGVKFSAKAQMQIWDRTVIDYEKIFYEKEFPISQSTAFAYPSLTTNTVTGITQNAAQSGGNITASGGATITSRGVCWSTTSSPTIGNTHTTDGNGTGSFTSSITGLTANTTYYVRAYATNSAGTGYGNEINFITQSTPVVTLPSVTTTAISAITQTTAQSGGNVTSDGNATVTSRGICWSTSANPTIANNKTTDGIGINSFTSNLTGLTANTTYYVMAYAINSAGTAYGNQVSFTTTSGGVTGTVTDIDGNVYNTVTIGTQVWMAENLRTTKYNDGTSIPNVTNEGLWNYSTTQGYCWYNNDVNNKNTYGGLYNWFTVNTGKLCPAGWHVPTRTEWTTLTTFLGGENVAGGKLKEAGTTHWLSPNTGATNETGFSALPGGYRSSWGYFSISGIGAEGGWWSSTDEPSLREGLQGIGYYWLLSYNNSVSQAPMNNFSFGYSIRCLKN